ncbi:hypothetical protein ACS0TY_036369 [Phlomoides rotata]
MENPRFFWLSFLLVASFCVGLSNRATAAKADVGVILDLDTTLGKALKTCISMAIEDFYAKHENYSTVIVPHFRSSRSDIVDAASAAIDLLKNAQVMAIIGPVKSIQADFVIDIGDKVRVPIISPATSPSLSPKESPYFIRTAWCSSSQAKAIAAIVKDYGWREVVFIYEDTNYGSGLVPVLTKDLLNSNAVVSHQSVVSPSAGDGQILNELLKLKTMQTRVFIVHMLPSLASRFLSLVNEAGMMSKGYAWIITDVITSFLDSYDSETIGAMQGVVGVKAYIPRSDELKNFTKRWSKRFHMENPDADRTELNILGVWAYDSITALAEAVEHVGVTSPRFMKPIDRGSLTDLEAIGTSNAGPSLVRLIRNFTSKGLSGDFRIYNGELLPSVYEIVNVIGKGETTLGFWTQKYGISEAFNSTRIGDLTVLWPGKTNEVPKGWEIPTSGKKLRVGVPVKGGFSEFIKVERDPKTKAVKATGFSVQVFEEVIKSMPYAVPFEYVPFEKPDGEAAGDYDELIYQIYLQKFDAVVGDVTITTNRSKYVDFTIPYTESGVATIVPIKDNQRKNAWVFMKPLTTGLWLTIGAFFVFIGFVVWVLEHHENEDFQGPPLQQVGKMFWYSFSTLVFAQRERVTSNLTRFVVIVWVFAVLVLTSSYTANLTSMLTVQQLQPAITDIYDLIKNGQYIGYQNGSFIKGLLNNMHFDNSMFRTYSTLQEYAEALSEGSSKGGVAAIVEELPYIRCFLSKYCHKYTMIGPNYQTSGFGFAFPKGSPLAADFSRAILKLKEDEKMVRISRTWFKEEKECIGSDGTMITSESLSLDSFKGLFLIAGLSSSLALVIFFVTFLREQRDILTSTASIKQKLHDLARVFTQGKTEESASKESTTPDSGEDVYAPSPAVSIACDQEDEEGFTTTESTTPAHHATEG